MRGTEVPSLVHEGGKTRHENFIVKVLGEYFHLPYNAQVVVDFHDMNRVLRRKDLNFYMVTLFAL